MGVGLVATGVEQAVGAGKERVEDDDGVDLGAEAGFFERKPEEKPPNCFTGFLVGRVEAVGGAAGEVEDEGGEVATGNELGAKDGPATGSLISTIFSSGAEASPTGFSRAFSPSRSRSRSRSASSSFSISSKIETMSSFGPVGSSAGAEDAAGAFGVGLGVDAVVRGIADGAGTLRGSAEDARGQRESHVLGGRNSLTTCLPPFLMR